MIELTRKQLDEIFVHARQEHPHECCGLLGGRGDFVASVYRLKNVAAHLLVEYEAAPEDLFAAQKLMRERGERLLGIYHSHPDQAEPVPSATDVRRAFYPEAVYFIVGFCDDKPVLRGFRLFEREHRWEKIEFTVSD